MIGDHLLENNPSEGIDPIWVEHEQTAALLHRGVEPAVEARLFGDMLDFATQVATKQGVAPPNTPEDIASSAVLRVYNRLKSPGYEARSIRGYVATAVRNTAINEWRNSERRIRLETIEVNDRDGRFSVGDVTEGAVMAERGMDLPSPSLGGLSVNGLLSAISEQYAGAVRLVDMEGLSYLEAAEELDVPVGTVMSRLHRGRKQLAKMLSEG